MFARESPQLDSGDSSKSSLLAIEQTSNIASTLTHPRKLSIPVPTSGSDSDTSPPLSPHISAKHSAALCRSRQLDEQDFSILSLMKSNGEFVSYLSKDSAMCQKICSKTLKPGSHHYPSMAKRTIEYLSLYFILEQLKKM